VTAQFPGVCEFCGGPRVWTHVDEEIFVACSIECSLWLESLCQLDLFGEEGVTPRERSGDEMKDESASDLKRLTILSEDGLPF